MAVSLPGVDDGESGSGLQAVQDDTPQWWLVHCKPRQEKRLSEELSAVEIAHYLPTVRCRAMTRGRARFTIQPLFAGYAFLYATELQRRTALAMGRIVATHFVTDQQGLAIQLVTISELIEKGVPLRAEERLTSGQQVRVKAGPFRDMRGTVLRRQGKTRLYLQVSDLLGGVSLEIDQEMIEPYS